MPCHIEISEIFNSVFLLQVLIDGCRVLLETTVMLRAYLMFLRKH